MGRVLLIGLVALLVGCGTRAPVDDPETVTRPAAHVVERGETLIRIAWRYGLDYRDIATWNQLDSPDRILVGQRLRLYPPGTRVAASATPTRVGPSPQTRPAAPVPEREVRPGIGDGDWDWPTQGRVVNRFNPNQPGAKGIHISGTPGQTVHAASGGEIVYRGSGLRGYGRLLVVKHSDSTLSAYGHLGRIFVSEGDRVRKGQAIAELGESGPQTILHFEIRQNGNPVDPMRYLPG